MYTTTPDHAAPRDETLDRIMRLSGLLLIAASVFFLWKNLGYGASDDVIFSMTALLGAFTLTSSWLPYKR